jgi:alpha-1,3-rhamnosyltransferase
MESPLVTVIVPSYNHVTYVELAIQSVLRQTYPNIELIVIDDGSTDGSGELLSGLAKRHGFRLEIQANKGLSRTLNKGISLARGKYICPFGSDDLMLLDRIEKQVHFMEVNPQIAACGGNQLLINADGMIIEKRQRFPPYRELDFEDVFLDRKPGIPASSAMLRRDVLEREGGYDPDIRLEDMYMWFKLTSRGHRLAGLNDVLIYYRKHATNSYKNVVYMADNMLKTYAPYIDHPRYDDVVNRYLVSAFLRASKGNKRSAFDIFKRISPRYYNGKVLRALFHLLRP